MTIRLALFLQSQIGESDCEAIHDGLVAQPVNAVSSGAYVVAGLWLVIRALRNRTEETATQVVFGLALASVGLGSIAFHGPTPPGARLLHDLTIAAVFAVMAARNLGSWADWAEATVLGTFGALTVVVGVVMAVSPDAGNFVTGVLGVVAVGSEIYLYRTGRRGPLSPRTTRWLVAIVALFAIAGVVNLLGRTDAPWCDPDSLYQGHAVWHALTAAAFGLYAYVSFPTHASTPTRSN